MESCHTTCPKSACINPEIHHCPTVALLGQQKNTNKDWNNITSQQQPLTACLHLKGNVRQSFIAPHWADRLKKILPDINLATGATICFKKTKPYQYFYVYNVCNLIILITYTDNEFACQCKVQMWPNSLPSAAIVALLALLFGWCNAEQLARR